MTEKVLYTPEGAHVVPEEGAPTQNDFDVALLNHLATTNRLLDLLVRLECGVIKRADLKADIMAAEAAIREAQRQAIEAAAAAEMDRLAEEEGAEVEAKDEEGQGDASVEAQPNRELRRQRAKHARRAKGARARRPR